jgi:hypothetical protein
MRTPGQPIAARAQNWNIWRDIKAAQPASMAANNRRSGRANIFRPSRRGDAVLVPDSADDHDCHAYGFAVLHNHACRQRATFGRVGCQPAVQAARRSPPSAAVDEIQQVVGLPPCRQVGARSP